VERSGRAAALGGGRGRIFDFRVVLLGQRGAVGRPLHGFRSDPFAKKLGCCDRHGCDRFGPEPTPQHSIPQRPLEGLRSRAAVLGTRRESRSALPRPKSHWAVVRRARRDSRTRAPIRDGWDPSRRGSTHRRVPRSPPGAVPGRDSHLTRDLTQSRVTGHCRNPNCRVARGGHPPRALSRSGQGDCHHPAPPLMRLVVTNPRSEP